MVREKTSKKDLGVQSHFVNTNEQKGAHIQKGTERQSDGLQYFNKYSLSTQ